MILGSLIASTVAVARVESSSVRVYPGELRNAYAKTEPRLSLLHLLVMTQKSILSIHKTAPRHNASPPSYHTILFTV